ncbi:hypothetical protein EX30DRAFT_176058 [Ascodesmis nigricans]|uniref:Uncharacterized protein n=1 Tax=Ascodesmis nigricans TaxID=341454 RepID=A0A4S2MLN8_9PEZI|nr:hypothetical protein EX30DRAFT_176058 [Ascodesmis nigricans]
MTGSSNHHRPSEEQKPSISTPAVSANEKDKHKHHRHVWRVPSVRVSGSYARFIQELTKAICRSPNGDNHARTGIHALQASSERKPYGISRLHTLIHRDSTSVLDSDSRETPRVIRGERLSDRGKHDCGADILTVIALIAAAPSLPRVRFTQRFHPCLPTVT